MSRAVSVSSRDLNLECDLKKALPGFRWFGAKSKVIRKVAVLDRLPLPEAGPSIQLLLCEVAYTAGKADTYLIPVDLETRSEAEPLGKDPAGNASFSRALLKRVLDGTSSTAGRGYLTSSCLKPVAGRIPVPHLMKGEQSNTSIRFGQSYMLKMMRKLEAGASPEVEIGRHLSEGRGFTNSPRLIGTLDYTGVGQAPMTLCCVHQFVPAKGDAWSVFQKRLVRWAKSDAVNKLPALPEGWLEASRKPMPASVMKTLEPFAGWAELLGRRTGEMHIALARKGRFPDFTPERITAATQVGLVGALIKQTADTLEMLRRARSSLPVNIWLDVYRLLGLESSICKRFSPLKRKPVTAVAIRTHGDYHLGQVLFTGRDFMIIDFEGEPARSLAERRCKYSPLRDVAGMLRSFHYAASMGLGDAGGDASDRWTDWISAAFMRGYLAVRPVGVPADRRDLALLLDVYLLEKALYELRYEINNRPGWVRVPLSGILGLMEEKQ